MLITHSNSGQYGWATALERPGLVRAVVAYEPGQYVFPKGEPPAAMAMSEQLAGVMDAREIPLEDFKKLAGMPILVVFGDNIATEPGDNFNSEVWRISSARARQFVDAVNRHGGDARLVFLPDLGMRDNTHIPFADLNNLAVADQLERFLREKGLDGRDAPHQGSRQKSISLTIPLER